MGSPRIGVVVPLYNKAEFVVEAVQSVLLQQPPVAEIVVVDDGSSDDGAARVRALHDARLRVVKQANAGVSAARNRGIEELDSEWVAFLDADDRYCDGFIAAVMDMIGRFPGAVMHATWYLRETPQGERLGVPRVTDRTMDGHCGLLADFYAHWAREPIFNASSVCAKRDLMLQAAILFPPGERLGEDQDVWFRLAEHGPIAYCPRPLAVYRVGVTGSATAAHRPIAILPCYERLAARLRSGEVPPHMRRSARRLLASHRLNIARALLDCQRRDEAKALVFDPSSLGNPLYWLRTAVRVAFTPRTATPSVGDS